MSVYLDANVLVALVVTDPLNDRVAKAMRALKDSLVVSNLSAAEFSSTIATRVRMGHLRKDEARTAFANFDLWCANYTSRVEIEAIDFAAAIALLRRLEFPIRTPDALHIAVVHRTECKLLTFDVAMNRVARTLGVRLEKH